jgi:hypothetical protein
VCNHGIIIDWIIEYVWTSPSTKHFKSINLESITQISVFKNSSDINDKSRTDHTDFVYILDIEAIGTIHLAHYPPVCECVAAIDC